MQVAGLIASLYHGCYVRQVLDEWRESEHQGQMRVAVAQSRMSSVATAARPKPARWTATKLAFDRFRAWIRGEQRLALVVWRLQTDDVQRRLMTKGRFPLLQLIGFFDAVYLFCSAACVPEWRSRFLAQDWQTGRKATSRLWRFHLHALLEKVHAKASLLVMSRISPLPL